MAETEVVDTGIGRAPDDIIEREAGGCWGNALAIVELEQAAYCVEETFGYDDRNELQVELTAKVKELRALLAKIAVTVHGDLTRKIMCSKCSARGWYLTGPRDDSTKTTCDDCDGKGYTINEES